MGMNFSYVPPKENREMTALLQAAVERGTTFFDTSLERLEENIGAVKVELTLDDLGEIESPDSKISV